MMSARGLRSVVFLACVGCAAPVLASDPVGIYAVIDKVVVEPVSGATERIQVWGVFALSDGRSGDGYQAPQTGYLYLALKPGKEDVCRKEWADLKALAGTGEGVGFGFRYQSPVRVRKAGDRVESPDAHPTGVGVTRMGAQHNQPKILQDLRKLAGRSAH
jgi:hypothetical protein